ncbi:MAG: DNA recombination/repair protein RecA, partial [Clostridiales bacterium]|nr:DNA recombination/repair protein RecA [Clostridiales bacterium]
GRDNARKYLQDNPDIAQEIEAAIRAEMMPSELRTESEDEQTADSDA